MRSLLRRRGGLPDRLPDAAQMIERRLRQLTGGGSANPLCQVGDDRHDHDSAIGNLARLLIAMRGAFRFRKVGEKNRIPRHAEFPHVGFKILLGRKHRVSYLAAGVLAR